MTASSQQFGGAPLPEAYIFESVRTPRAKGRANGALHVLPPVELAASVLSSLDARTGFSRAAPEDIIFGVGDGVNDQGADIARSALLTAGMPESIPGSTVSRFCSSGLDAVNAAAARIMAGQGDLIVAGGIEMMSLIPMGGTGGPNGSDAVFNDRINMIPQGLSADLMATLFGHSRETVDGFALESQRRAAVAQREGRFDRSVVPVVDADGETLIARDDYLRPDTTLETLAQLPPAFKNLGMQGGFDAIARRRYPEILKVEHVHTAGNSSGIVDGAAAVLIGSREGGARLGLKPRAVIRSFANSAVDPCIMLTGPSDATRIALARVGKKFSDVDLYEVNEAFASVALYFMEQTGVGHERINVNGGSIALGHPIGATGAVLLGTLVDELERTGKHSGVVTLCVGLGMAVAAYVERVG